MTVKLILTVIQVLLGVFLTAVVLLQEAKTAGMNSAVGGGADTFLSKNKAKSWDAKLARWTGRCRRRRPRHCSCRRSWPLAEGPRQ